MEERDVLEKAIENAYDGTESYDLGTDERKAASEELRDLYKIHVERFKAYDSSELERARLEAEKKKAERQAELDEEKIKADERKDKRNVFVKVAQLIGVSLIAALMLVVDSDNWMGRGCRTASSFIQKFLKIG